MKVEKALEKFVDDGGRFLFKRPRNVFTLLDKVFFYITVTAFALTILVLII